MICTAVLMSPIRIANDPRIVLLEVTAYTASQEECGKSDGITASGVRAQESHVAAPLSVPFGAKIYSPKHGWLTVTDRGGAIHGRRLDVYVPEVSAAKKWGRQRIPIIIPAGIEWPDK
jgi:3D (Asp-Asp-Asp) domain-containing protein